MKSIRKRSFSGGKDARFAKIFFARDRLSLLLREKDLDDAIRAPLDAREAKKLLKHIEAWDGRVSSQWKARANAHEKKMAEGDPYGCAEVYKALAQRRETDSLSAADRQHLKQSADSLTEELASALDKSPDEIRECIEAAALG